jgi:hypothetical protein
MSQKGMGFLVVKNQDTSFLGLKYFYKAVSLLNFLRLAGLPPFAPYQDFFHKAISFEGPYFFCPLIFNFSFIGHLFNCFTDVVL